MQITLVDELIARLVLALERYERRIRARFDRRAQSAGLGAVLQQHRWRIVHLAVLAQQRVEAQALHLGARRDDAVQENATRGVVHAQRGRRRRADRGRRRRQDKVLRALAADGAEAGDKAKARGGDRKAQPVMMMMMVTMIVMMIMMMVTTTTTTAVTPPPPSPRYHASSQQSEMSTQSCVHTTPPPSQLRARMVSLTPYHPTSRTYIIAPTSRICDVVAAVDARRRGRRRRRRGARGKRRRGRRRRRRRRWLEDRRRRRAVAEAALGARVLRGAKEKEKEETREGGGGGGGEGEKRGEAE